MPLKLHAAQNFAMIFKVQRKKYLQPETQLAKIRQFG
jgi:hypothetical protein